MRGAHVAAGGERRQPLDVHPEHLGEEPRLGLAELREPGGDGLDGAVPLAELDGPVAGQRPDGCCEAVRGQGAGEGRHAADDVVSGGADRVGVPSAELGNPCVREVADGVLPAESGDEAEGLRGQV